MKLRNGSALGRLVGGTSALVLGISVISLAQPVAAQELEVGVLPSANGYVMVDVPTQIAIGGAPSAQVYVRNSEKAKKKWRLIGRSTPNRALTHTFTDNGLQQIRIKPKGAKAKKITVPVYYQTGGGPIETFAGTLFTWSSQVQPFRSTSVPLEADRGCVLVDVGVEGSTLKRPTIEVVSSGAPSWSGQSESDQPLAQTGIPVSGDTVVTVGAGYSGPGYIKFGVNAVCLNQQSN